MTNMARPDPIIERFIGGDPVTGTQALTELLTLGDVGEEALFSQPIEEPRTVQVSRRWLRYVASREKTVVGRLIDRMQKQDRFNDSYQAAYLFAGISENRAATNALYEATYRNQQRFPSLLHIHPLEKRECFRYRKAG